MAEQLIVVQASRAGRRRAGRAWPAGPVAVVVVEDGQAPPPDGISVTAAQLAQLEADPEIVVSRGGAAAEQTTPAGRVRAAADLSAAQLATELSARLRAGDRSPGLSAADLRDALILAAMLELVPGDEDHWTQGGDPEIAALKRISGLSSISAAERDRLWAGRRAPEAAS